MNNDFRQWPEMPQPEDLKRYLKGFDFFERHVQGQWEGDLYVETHVTRFYETLRFFSEPAAERSDSRARRHSLLLHDPALTIPRRPSRHAEFL